MGGLFKPKAPKQEEQEDSKWEPILSPLNPSSSARNNITRAKGNRSKGGQGLGGFPTVLGGVLGG